MGGPKFELGIAGCTDLDEIFLAAIVHLDASDCLRMAAVERFRESQNGRERADRLSLLRAERGVIAVRFLGR